MFRQPEVTGHGPIGQNVSSRQVLSQRFLVREEFNPSSPPGKDSRHIIIDTLLGGFILFTGGYNHHEVGSCIGKVEKNRDNTIRRAHSIESSE